MTADPAAAATPGRPAVAPRAAERAHAGGQPAPTGPWPRGVPRQATMTIGQLLERLKAEFPEITVSKLRFLENEGLITPERTGSGYRKYSAADVVRFRYILAAQRDRFWPLRVIGDRLAELDHGEEGHEPQLEAAALGPMPSAPAEGRLAPGELAALAGATESDVEDLIRLGILQAGRSGLLPSGDAAIVRLVASLTPYGIEARHLRPIVSAVLQESALIERATEPISRSHRDDAREAAGQWAEELAGILSAIHTALLRRAARERG